MASLQSRQKGGFFIFFFSCLPATGQSLTSLTVITISTLIYRKIPTVEGVLSRTLCPYLILLDFV